MHYKLIELQDYSGPECTIYSLILRGQNETLLDEFISEYDHLYGAEIDDMLDRLYRIGNDDGARIGYFKENEGKPGDGVCALFDRPNKKLRLYCIRYGMNVIIIGGGGKKPKDVQRWQDEPGLAKNAELIIALAQHINNRLRNKEDLWWSTDHMLIEGDLINYDDDEETTG